MQGYRTLVVCKRLIGKNDGNRLVEEIRQAKAIVNNQERFEKLEIVHAKAEQGLEVRFAPFFINIHRDWKFAAGPLRRYLIF